MSQIREWLEQAGGKKIRESGDGNIVSTCPFHTDNSPSFCIRADTGLFICYSAKCGVSGNLVNFLVSGLKWSFKRAVKAAESANVFLLQDPRQVEIPAYGSREKQRAGKDGVVIRDGHLGLYAFCPSYMLRRGYSKATLRTWEIGFDYGMRRVTIPVRDKSGLLIGISKRKVDEWQEPPYLHLGFWKGDHLYGQHQPRASSAQTFIVEGQCDLLSVYERVPQQRVQALSTMGSRVSKRQMDLIRKISGDIVLAFDNDTDGWAVTHKVGDYLASHGKNCLVAQTYPDGVKDPGDLLKAKEKDVERFLTELVSFNKWKYKQVFRGRYG